MLHTIKRTGKTKPILEMIARQRVARPDIENIYVTPAGFKSLCEAMSLKQLASKKVSGDKIDCGDFFIIAR